MIKRLLKFYSLLIQEASLSPRSRHLTQTGKKSQSISSNASYSYHQKIWIEEVSWSVRCDDLRHIRTAVFINEQQIDPAEEWDPADQYARHLLSICEGKPVGCVRIIDDHKIGRLAVLKHIRGKNVGSKLLRSAIDIVRQNGKEPTLSSQIGAMTFYAKHGFLPDGPIFNEAGIAHRQMTLNIDSDKALTPLDARSLSFETQNLLVSIEPRLQNGVMRIKSLRLSEDNIQWLVPRLCFYASTRGAHTLILGIPEGEVTFPLDTTNHSENSEFKENLL